MFEECVMRAITIAAAGLLIGLAGCGDQTTTPQQTAQATPPAAAPCNCGQTAVPDNHLTRLSYVPRHHRRHYEGRYHGSGTARSEESVQSYGYVSASRVSYTESSESYSSGGYEREGYVRGGHHYYRGDVQWVDGYGRGYFAGQRPTVAQSMTGKRMDVGHGYDVDCPEGYHQDGY
jgi:hypothetical protein